MNLVRIIFLTKIGNYEFKENNYLLKVVVNYIICNTVIM